MGRRKIPPPLAKFKKGDRVEIFAGKWEGVTGIVVDLFLCGTGSHQVWDCVVFTHRKKFDEKTGLSNRWSIPVTTGCLKLLKRKK